jgi:UDP-N-acetylmuramate dehydrogenase
MQIRENELLAPYTTFKIGGPARFFCVVESAADLQEALKFAADHNLNIYILGGGSNLLVSDNGFDGLVIKIGMKGVKILSENDQNLILQVASGEPWDKVVELAVKNGWWGIENLSHIPGSAGAVVVQNVGAYGQETSSVVENAEVFDRTDGKIKILANKDCRFSYRRSIFNGSEKNRYVILSINFKLAKNGQANLAYRDLKERFINTSPTLEEIRQAVTEIRDKKFPYPIEPKSGNAGSFFKNVVLDNETYDCVEKIIGKRFGEGILQKLHNKVFREGDTVKIPTAFLLDICELKNIQIGGARINENQPLVIVNATGEAKALDVIKLAGLVKETVFEKTGLKLSLEPDLVGFSTVELKEIEK